MLKRIVPTTELGARIRKELARLGGQTLVITERGRPLAVAVSAERWNHLQEMVADLQDTVAVLHHRARGGRGRSAETVLREIEADST